MSTKMTFVAKNGFAAQWSILQVGDFQTNRPLGNFCFYWAVGASNRPVGSSGHQVGGSVVRIPNNVRNF
jgi:hypothetical protein